MQGESDRRMSFHSQQLKNFTSFESGNDLRIFSVPKPNQVQPCGFSQLVEQQSFSMEEAQVVPDFGELIEALNDDKIEELTDNVFESQEQPRIRQSVYQASTEISELPRERIGSSDSEDLEIYLKPCVLTPTPVDRLYSTLDIAETTVFKFPTISLEEQRPKQTNLREILKPERCQADQISSCSEGTVVNRLSTGAVESGFKRFQKPFCFTPHSKTLRYLCDDSQTWGNKYGKAGIGMDLYKVSCESDTSSRDAPIVMTLEAQIPNFPPLQTCKNQSSLPAKVYPHPEIPHESACIQEHVGSYVCLKQEKGYFSEEQLCSLPIPELVTDNFYGNCANSDRLQASQELSRGTESNKRKRNGRNSSIKNGVRKSEDGVSSKSDCKRAKKQAAASYFGLQNCKQEDEVKTASCFIDQLNSVRKPQTTESNVCGKSSKIIECNNSVHNDTEKQRRDNMKMKLRQLHLSLPEIEKREKVPKIAILRCAKKYICELENKTAELERIKLDQKELNRKLFSKLLALTNSRR